MAQLWQDPARHERRIAALAGLCGAERFCRERGQDLEKGQPRQGQGDGVLRKMAGNRLAGFRCLKKAEKRRPPTMGPFLGCEGSPAAALAGAPSASDRPSQSASGLAYSEFNRLIRARQSPWPGRAAVPFLKALSQP